MASSSVITSDTMSAHPSSSNAPTDLHAYLHYPEGLESSPQWTAHFIVPSSSAMDSASSKQPLHRDLALTSSPHSRTTGLPSTVSSSTTISCSPSNAAISSQTNNITYSSFCQNAGSVVNSSLSSSTPATRSGVQSSEPLVPSPSSNHVLNNHLSTRPRTSTQVFASTTDLAAHYGIPTTFPPLPSIQSRRLVSVTQPPSHTTAVSDFNALKTNYLNMLSQKSEPTPAPSTTEMSSATVSPADLMRPLADDFEGFLRSLGNPALSSPLIKSHSFPSAQSATGQPAMSPFEPNDYLTSPWTPSLDQFGESPGETPLSDFLDTPLIPDMDGAILTEPLFPESPLFASLGDSFESSKAPSGPSLDTSELLAFPTSPELGTPSLDPSYLISPPLSMDNIPLPVPSKPVDSPATKDISELNPSRRRSTATGTRKNITAESLVPLEAPTQSRRYLTPSATSRKELPAVFARKRARQQMLDGEEDELDEPLKPNASEVEQIEWKRRQNTLAARKSRKRKLMHQHALETQVSDLTQDREKWRQRALTLQGILQAHGIPFAEFQD